VLASLSTLDERGVAVRQTGDRDPLRGIQIPGVPAGGPQPASGAPSAGLAAAPTSMDRGKGPTSSSSALGGTGGVEGREATPAASCRRIACFGPPGGAEEAGSQKRQRTAGGAEEAGS
jgi:hypothetical protein